MINSGGAGAASPYAIGETFTIDGTLVGGTTVTHDVMITVGAVDGNGVITSATATGFAPGITQAQTTLSPTITDGSVFQMRLTFDDKGETVFQWGDKYDDHRFLGVARWLEQKSKEHNE